MAVKENFQTNLVRSELPSKAFDQDRTGVDGAMPAATEASMAV